MKREITEDDVLRSIKKRKDVGTRVRDIQEDLKYEDKETGKPIKPTSNKITKILERLNKQVEKIISDDGTPLYVPKIYTPKYKVLKALKDFKKTYGGHTHPSMKEIALIIKPPQDWETPKFRKEFLEVVKKVYPDWTPPHKYRDLIRVS